MHIASADLWAGAEAQLFTLAKALQSETDIRLTFLLLNDGILAEKLRQLQIPVYVLDEGKTGFLQLLRSTVALVRKLRPDIIHSHRTKEHIIGGIVGRLLKVPATVRTVHGFEEHPANRIEPRKRLVRIVDNYIASRWQTGIVAVSRPLSKSLTKEYGTKVRYIPNGIDIELYTDIAKKCSNSALRVVFIGRLTPVKRVDIFLEIAKIASQNNSIPIAFHVLGDGPLLEECEAFIDSNCLQKIVHMRGFVEDVVTELAEADLMLITSDSEGLPMVLLEAMLSRVTVISRNVGDIPEVLESGKYGVLVHSDDPELFWQYIKQFSRSEFDHARKNESARRHVIDRYSSRQCARRYTQFYVDLLQGNH